MKWKQGNEHHYWAILKGFNFGTQKSDSNDMSWVQRLVGGRDTLITSLPDQCTSATSSESLF